MCSGVTCYDVPIATNASSAVSVVAVVPSEAALDVYTVSACNAGGCSAPLLVNAPQVAWMQADVGSTSASPGGWVRLFGTALAYDSLGRCTPTLNGGTSNTSVRIEPLSGGPALPLTVTSATCYAVTAVIPAATPPGEYLLYVNNGLPSCGWTNATKTPGAGALLSITPRTQWPTDVFDVGALGVWGALAAAANNSGGIVHFPRGSYQFNENHTLNAIPPFTQVSR